MNGGGRGRWGCGTVGRGCGKWWEWEIPHGDFHAADEVAADAGSATALWEATEEDSIDWPHIGEDVDVAVCEVFGCHFDIPFCWASRNQHCTTLVFKGDAVEVFFFVIGSCDEDGVCVFDSILKDGLTNVDYVIAAVAWSIGIEGGGEDVGVFAGLCEEELLDVVDECIMVLADGDGAEGG